MSRRWRAHCNPTTLRVLHTRATKAHSPWTLTPDTSPKGNWYRTLLMYPSRQTSILTIYWRMHEGSILSGLRTISCSICRGRLERMEPPSECISNGTRIDLSDLSRYSALQPSQFKEGDIVEATVAFIAYPSGPHSYKLVTTLRALALVSSQFREVRIVSGASMHGFSHNECRRPNGGVWNTWQAFAHRRRHPGPALNHKQRVP